MWPILGGLTTRLIALTYPEVLYQSFGIVKAIVDSVLAQVGSRICISYNPEWQASY